MVLLEMLDFTIKRVIEVNIKRRSADRGIVVIPCIFSKPNENLAWIKNKTSQINRFLFSFCLQPEYNIKLIMSFSITEPKKTNIALCIYY
jgi:hypothetical protein